MLLLVAGALGLLLGLSAHDLAIQVLRDDRSLRPYQGTCPNCGYERGWLVLRCPQCGRRVVRELVVALVTALAAVGFANTVGLVWALVAYLGFAVLGAALAVTDIEAFRIADRLNIPGTVILALAVAAASLADGTVDALWRGLAGAAVYFGGALAVFLVVRGRGFGAGDVKLAVQLGLFTAYISWGTLGWAVFTTVLIGGVIALLLLAAGAAKRDTELPYGPPMILGAWVAIALAGLGVFPVGT